MIETIKTNRSLRLQSRNVLIALILIIVARFVFTEEESFISMILWGLSFIVGGYYKAVEGYHKTIESRALNVEFLMIIAALAAFITQDYHEGAILIFIFAVSGVMETYANTKSEKALTSLLKLSPKTAVKIKNDKEEVVLINTLNVGDIVVVKVGQQIPVDGVVIKGTASINQAAITGEFIPVTKKEGDDVFAGSLNEDSSIWVKVSKDPKESTVQKIIDFVQQAQKSKTKSQSFIERFERWYVYAVIALALSFMIIPYWLGWLSWQDAFYRGVIVLVVGSPCAVVASITPAILSSLSYGATHGVLIKGGEHLEQLRKVDTIVFDKTGTITTGRPQVQEVVVVDGVDKSMMIRIMVNIERNSNHPLAKSIAIHFKDIPYLDIQTKEIPGQGMEATINGSVYRVGRFEVDSDNQLQTKQQQYIEDGQTIVEIIRDQQHVGFISLKDTIRDNAKDVVTRLNAMNIKTVLLTGDQKHAAQSIASLTNVSSYEYDCLPECKSDVIESYKRDSKVVMMIGDGINDAPSLAIADIGAAMGDATDVSLETADVVFMNNNLQNVIELLKISKKAQRIINQNLTFSISVILFLLISNALGVVQLPYGVIAHEGSTILVILNSLRLLRMS
jgi:Cd2+/Zn2+-exporting ATPase